MSLDATDAMMIVPGATTESSTASPRAAAASASAAAPVSASASHPNVSARKAPRGTTPRRFTVERKDMEFGLYLASIHEIKAWVCLLSVILLLLNIPFTHPLS